MSGLKEESSKGTISLAGFIPSTAIIVLLHCAPCPLRVCTCTLSSEVGADTNTATTKGRRNRHTVFFGNIWGKKKKVLIQLRTGIARKFESKQTLDAEFVGSKRCQVVVQIEVEGLCPLEVGAHLVEVELLYKLHLYYHQPYHLHKRSQHMPDDLTIWKEVVSKGKKGLNQLKVWLLLYLES